MKRDPDLSADLMELPHHGSWREIAAAFLAQVGPEQVVQSTGPARFQLDRWQEAIGERVRWVTARDGAVSILLK